MEKDPKRFLDLIDSEEELPPRSVVHRRGRKRRKIRKTKTNIHLLVTKLMFYLFFTLVGSLFIYYIMYKK